MIVRCTYCGQSVDAPDEYNGYMIECPACHREFLAGAKRRTRTVDHHRNVKPAYDSHAMLCTVLGFIFPVIGILAGAIICKERGFKFALLGSLLSGAIGFLVALFAGFLNGLIVS